MTSLLKDRARTADVVSGSNCLEWVGTSCMVTYIVPILPT